MLTTVLHALGGLGLFLVGLLVLTDGLRRLAGESVHRILFRFTKSPATGAATGAALTALLQSSSVTTVATVGFVSAGVLAFPQALGILFGANVGTTITGWLVALLGFELELDLVVGPLLLAGVLLHLFGRGPLDPLGWALAGFAVLFVGLDAMQAAMAGLEGTVTPADFPDDTVPGRLLLVGIGVVVTLVTQSSSAGVATALTAVDAGAIELTQAAAMVIGMDVGTTSTTALATIGGSPATRRTGWSHVVYNLLTAIGALFLLDPYVGLLERFVPGGPAAHATLALVGFHTAFNGLGVLAAVPLASPFARLMTRLVPDPGGAPDPAERLDPKLLQDPTVASLTLLGVVREIAAALLDAIADGLDPHRPPRIDGRRLDAVERSTASARRFADRIDLLEPRPDAQRRLLGALHVIDHLERLAARSRHPDRVAAARDDDRLAPLADELRTSLAHAVRALAADAEDCGEPELLAVRDRVRDERRPYRDHILATVPTPEVALDDALVRLDAIRWLHRTAHHAWRIAHHLRAPGPEPERPPEG